MRMLRRVLPLAILLAAVLTVWWSGMLDQISWASLARHQADLATWTNRHMALAPCLYVLLYMAAAGLSVPAGAVISASGGLLFGPALGGTLAVIGATAGSTILFLAARSSIAEPLNRRGGSVMRAVRARLQHDGFFYLLAIRLIPAFPFWLVNLAAALSGMRLLPYIAATLFGIAPTTFVLAWIGAGAGDILAAGGQPNVRLIFSPQILGPLAALAVLSLLPLLFRRRARPDG
jgi:uncharacterized membrane protein YdjX (TVP38/TMEM64 family)